MQRRLSQLQLWLKVTSSTGDGSAVVVSNAPLFKPLCLDPRPFTNGVVKSFGGSFVCEEGLRKEGHRCRCILRRVKLGQICLLCRLRFEGKLTFVILNKPPILQRR